MARKLGTLIAIASLGTLIAASACSSGDDDDGGTGGTSGDGDGDGDTGGTSGDGDGDTGGTSGDGDGDTGGTDGSGGSTASTFFNFDSTLEGLVIDYVENFDEPAMGGATNIPGISLEFDSSDGDPDAGSAKLMVDYAGFVGADDPDVLRKVHVAINLEASEDFTGKTVTARLKLVSGMPTNDDGESACPFNSKIFIKTVTDSWIWGNGVVVDLNEEGTWIEASFDVDDPVYTDDEFDATDTLQIGMEFTPSPTTGCTTGEVVFQIDTIAY